jgi:hypothetical protein
VGTASFAADMHRDQGPKHERNPRFRAAYVFDFRQHEPAEATVDNKQPTPGEWVIMGAGALMLIASFLDFAGDTSAWGSGAFPIATLLALYGVVAALQIALTKFANVHFPDRVGSFTWEQVHLLLGLFAALMGIGWVVSGIDNKGIGLWLLTIGGIALLAGALMLQRERSTGAIS